MSSNQLMEDQTVSTAQPLDCGFVPDMLDPFVREQLYVSLADPRMKAKVEGLRKELQSSPDTARRFLEEAGIVDESGRLTKHFGG